MKPIQELTRPTPSLNRAQQLKRGGTPCVVGDRQQTSRSPRSCLLDKQQPGSEEIIEVLNFSKALSLIRKQQL